MQGECDRKTAAGAMSREYPQHPRVGIGVVVLRGPLEAPEVLVVQRGRPPRLGEWGIPGGAQELGETIFEAAAREVLEETGATVEPRAVITALDGIQRDEAGRVRYHYTLVEVLAEWRSGEIRAQDDALDAAWLVPDAVAERVAWDKTLEVIGAGLALRTPS